MDPRRRYLVFASAVVVTGVLSGTAGALTTLLVHAVEHLVFGYEQGPLLIGIRGASAERRVVGPALGCLLAGVGWWWLRRRTTVPDLGDTIRGDRPFLHRPMGFDALMQVLAVGAGASLGREQAPRLFAAALAEIAIRYGSFAAPERRLLLAGASGAGLAAVYNVPVAGVLFACGIVLGNWRPMTVAVAAAISATATLTAWPVTRGAPTFSWPDTEYSARALLFAVVMMPLAAAIGAAFTGLVRRSRPEPAPAGAAIVARLGAAGALIGAVSIVLPQLPGNGKSIVEQSLSGGDTLLGTALAFAAKPLLTALFLRAGAVGGLLTPALSTGVAAGATIALALQWAGIVTSVPTLSLIAGAAVLGITQRAPVFAAVFTAELTRPPPAVAAMLLLAAVGAHVVAGRWAARRRHPM